MASWASATCPRSVAACSAGAAGPEGGALLEERRKPRAVDLAPPPAKAGGGWEGVVTDRGDAAPLPCLRRGESRKLAASAAPTRVSPRTGATARDNTAQ